MALFYCCLMMIYSRFLTDLSSSFSMKTRLTCFDDLRMMMMCCRVVFLVPVSMMMMMTRICSISLVVLSPFPVP